MKTVIKKIPLLTIALMLIAMSAISEECDIDPEFLGVKYENHDHLLDQQNSGDSQEHAHKESEVESEVRHLNIWRRGQEVINERPEDQISQIWNRLPNGRLRLVKVFDGYNRSIEYQAADLSQGASQEANDPEWQSKYQLITDDFIKEMKLVGTEGGGCELKEQYVINGFMGNPDIKFEVHWLKHLKVASFFKRETDKDEFTMQLVELVTDPERVNASFDQRDAYQSTDYADIGDNESDPFLLKMMNLGFIEHGASGFYNADGQQMQGHSGHSH